MKIRYLIFSLILGFGFWSFMAFNFAQDRKGSKRNSPQSTVSLNISHKVPGDLPSDQSTEKDLATFAWNEFFALNWKAAWTPQDSIRGVPDQTWSLQEGDGVPELAVWETYTHRSELRPASGNRDKNLTYGRPDYTFVNSDSVNAGKNPVDLSQYWNLLDEDNEIGSAYLYAYEGEEQVLYMAKTNLVEYNYIRTNYPTDSVLYKAVDKLGSLKKNSQKLDTLKKLTPEQMCDPEFRKGYVCLPCGDNQGNEGAIEIKAAFRKLTSEDTPSRFITKNVVYFIEEPKGIFTAKTDVFGLIGLHIIHKTKNYPAFVFASWEQVDIRNTNMQTIGLDTPFVNGKKYVDLDPHRMIPVIERSITETIRGVNEEAKSLITKTNGKSPWQYYQLIGVQATPLNYNDRDSDNNYFMANYAVESDLKLTNFHGSFVDPFDDQVQNIVFNHESFNMGGCQGCHGQAQVNFGTDFSFLLDKGNNKPVITPEPKINFIKALLEANSLLPEK